ncbi:MAG: hypothetical protein PWR08_479 [Thermoanaerobacterium sp.]|uniref:hypothetical protein n=1 Tax=Thermoanaerobacterium thermosaccharolyticum TaxID=1517 RepID=UPI0026528C15|nr:hypothetical protein [Thermoanaerobacterium sp.]WHE06431.1 hypothetical protein PGH24_09675 [Thermoanaerobacterium thermosaccharolyticum]
MIGINYIYDNLDSLSGSEVKLLLFLLKHANKNPVHITTDEFKNGKLDDAKKRLDTGTGLSAGAISESIKKLIDKKLLICFIDNVDMGRIKKYYMLSNNKDVRNITYAFDKETGEFINYEKWFESLNLDATTKNETTLLNNGSSKSETIENSPVSKSDDIYTMYNNIYKSYHTDRLKDNNNVIDQSINDSRDRSDLDNHSIYHRDFNTLESLPSYKKLKEEGEKCNKIGQSKNEVSNSIKSKNESTISSTLIDAIKSKYKLNDDDIKVCLSRMKGKEIKYPAKFLNKVAENYVKEKELFSQIEATKQPKRDYEVPRNYFNSYPQRKYNIDELERYLLTGRASDDHVFPSFT